MGCVLNLNFAESKAVDEVVCRSLRTKTRQTTSELKTGRQDILMANNGATPTQKTDNGPEGAG